MKKLIAILLLLALLLCGCARQMEQMGNGQAATRFSVVDEYQGFKIIVDMDTGVMYAVTTPDHVGNAYGITLLVNYDGSPRTYPAFDAREDRLP